MYTAATFGAGGGLVEGGCPRYLVSRSILGELLGAYVTSRSLALHMICGQSSPVLRGHGQEAVLLGVN